MDTIDIPHAMKGRPRDARGYPITYVTLIREDGTPDFRALEPIRQHECVRDKRCAMCGRRLKGDFAFIGGPLCYVNRCFLDPAMHYDCALYAMRVCPHLARAKGRHAEYTAEDRETLRIVPFAGSGAKVERFMLGRTTGYRLIVYRGEPLIRAEPWLSVQWFRDGVEITTGDTP